METGGEKGVALLEVLVALTIVTTAGFATIGVLDGALRDTRIHGAAEHRQARANGLLLQYALMTRRELDQRIGQQEMDSMLVRVARPRRELYRVAVSEALYPAHEMLVTVIFRPVEQQ